MKARIGILGYGEIGQAIHQLYSNKDNYEVFVKDLQRDDGLYQLDVLNVSIPYSDSFDFVDVVKRNVKACDAKTVIIHSTVAVGTTRKIKNELPITNIAHSPCRGVHPNLYEGLLTFEKLVGSCISRDAQIASQHLVELGVKTHICKNPETTELAKLLDTTYYGLCIAFHGEAQRACETFDANFEEVMTLYNKTYNEGYRLLNKPNVVRPVLTPPRGGIGGHCVVQNAELLSKQFESKAIDLILEHKK